MKGLDVGIYYLNDITAASFIKSIANVTQEDVVHKLDTAKYFSITCDGSTYFTGEGLNKFCTFVYALKEQLMMHSFQYVLRTLHLQQIYPK